MQVELIYHAETGTVLSLLTRAASVDDDGSVAALTGRHLVLHGPTITQSITVRPDRLERFSLEQDDQIEQLLFDPWAFGVKDKALVSYDKTMTLEWIDPKFKLTLSAAPAAGLKVVFLIRHDIGTMLTQREADGVKTVFESDEVSDAKWALTLVRGYRGKAKAAS